MYIDIAVLAIYMPRSWCCHQRRDSNWRFPENAPPRWSRQQIQLVRQQISIWNFTVTPMWSGWCLWVFHAHTSYSPASNEHQAATVWQKKNQSFAQQASTQMNVSSVETILHTWMAWSRMWLKLNHIPLSLTIVSKSYCSSIHSGNQTVCLNFMCSHVSSHGQCSFVSTSFRFRNVMLRIVSPKVCLCCLTWLSGNVDEVQFQRRARVFVFFKSAMLGMVLYPHKIWN